MNQSTLDIGFAHDRTTGKEDWLTPPQLLRSLGEFDLDPCSPMPRPWDTAKQHYTMADNGLLKPWVGRVWLNPPYGNETARWMERLAKHGNGIALIFVMTETATFFPWVWDYATALLFIKGRIRFFTKEGREGGSAGAPSMLIAYGDNNAASLSTCGIAGKYLRNAQPGASSESEETMKYDVIKSTDQLMGIWGLGKVEKKNSDTKMIPHTNHSTPPAPVTASEGEMRAASDCVCGGAAVRKQ